MITYTAVVEAEYPQDAEKYVIDTANMEGNSVYDIEGSGSVTQMSDMVIHAEAVSEFKGSTWFDPDYDRKGRDQKDAEESKKAAEAAQKAKTAWDKSNFVYGPKPTTLQEAFGNVSDALAGKTPYFTVQEQRTLYELHCLSADKQREFFNYEFYGFRNGAMPVYNCRCARCEPFHKDNPLWEKLVAFEVQRGYSTRVNNQ
jgi:hypothetical protein